MWCFRKLRHAQCKLYVQSHIRSSVSLLALRSHIMIFFWTPSFFPPSHVLLSHQTATAACHHKATASNHRRRWWSCLYKRSQCVCVHVCAGLEGMNMCKGLFLSFFLPDHAGWCNVGSVLCFWVFRYLVLALVMPSESQQLLMLPWHKVDGSILQECREDEQKTHCHPDVYGLDIRDL